MKYYYYLLVLLILFAFQRCGKTQVENTLTQNTTKVKMDSTLTVDQITYIPYRIESFGGSGYFGLGFNITNSIDSFMLLATITNLPNPNVFEPHHLDSINHDVTVILEDVSRKDFYSYSGILTIVKPTDSTFHVQFDDVHVIDSLHRTHILNGGYWVK